MPGLFWDHSLLKFVLFEMTFKLFWALCACCGVLYVLCCVVLCCVVLCVCVCGRGVVACLGGCSIYEYNHSLLTSIMQHPTNE